MSISHACLTKLSAPSLFHMLRRERLFDRLDELRVKPLVWIGGPPGAGKTVLITSYLKERGLSANWFRAGEDPAAGDGGRCSLRELLGGLSASSLVILEDCQALAADGALTGLLADAERGIPLGAQLILIGRGEPPSGCARLIASGLMAELLPEELRFSIEETRALAGESCTDEAALNALQRRCGGWATGTAIALAGLRRHPQDPDQQDYRMRRELFDYFATEVFNRATPLERQVLVTTALLPRVSCRMAEGLSGSAQSWAVLAQVAARLGFTTRSAGVPVTYDFMPIFREFLLSRVEDTLPAQELSALAGRANALFEQYPAEPWLLKCDLIAAYAALRRGDRTACHRLLGDALTSVQSDPGTAQACAFFPAAMAQLCAEALQEGIAPESAHRLIECYRLPPPENAGRDWPWAFKVQVLGRFRLCKADAPIRFSRRTQRKPLELLQVLIAFGGTDVGTGPLTDALWPDSEGDAGYHALESALYRLRQLLGAPDAIKLAGGKLSLNRRLFWVDLWAFERELEMPARTEEEVAARLACSRQLYQGHFLEQETEKPWALKTRQALRDRFLRVIREAARTCEARRQWRAAMRIYQTGIELDLLAEDLYRGLMVCHRELGDHTEALQAYRRCRELLTRLLGVPPNAKTQAIYHSVRQSAVSEPG